MIRLNQYEKQSKSDVLDDVELNNFVLCKDKNCRPYRPTPWVMCHLTFENINLEEGNMNSSGSTDAIL